MGYHTHNYPVHGCHRNLLLIGSQYYCVPKYDILVFHRLVSIDSNHVINDMYMVFTVGIHDLIL